MVNSLANLPKLDEVVGHEQVVYTAGGIGGPRSVTLVSSFLKEAKSDSDKRWAVSTLADSGTTEGTQQLLNVLEQEQADSGLRLAAIKGLGRAVYTPAVGDTLGDLLKDDQAKSLERRTALASFDKQIKNAKLNAQDRRSIQTMVKGIKTSDPNLARELEQFQKRMDSTPE
jgi:hypothetical protein